MRHRRTSRGNYRRSVFAGTGSADCFERCLGEACLRFRWLVHAYAVMVNHFHIALTTPEPNLSEGVRRFELLGSDSVALKQARAELWEEKLQVIACAVEIDLARLPAPKSAGTKVQIAALIKKVTSVSNHWLAERLGMGGPGSVSSLVTRFQREGRTDGPEFRALHSRFAS